MLVAIAIPVFTSQLEKSRDATSISNLRSAYAEATTAIMVADGKEYKIGPTANPHVEVAAQATDGKVTAYVSDVSLRGQTKGFSGEDKDLSFTATGSLLGDDSEKGGQAGDYTAVFQLDTTTNVCQLTGLNKQDAKGTMKK